MDKIKVVVDRSRVDPTSITGKVMEAAGWSDDPGTGKAILVPDERGNPAYEVLNPMPFAPPIGWEPTPPLDQLIRERVADEVQRLKDSDELDDIIDAEDFDVDDELPPLETIYEVIAMKPEAPAIPKDAKKDLQDAVQADLDYEEMVVKQRLLRKRHREAVIAKQKEENDLLYGDPPPESGGEGEGGQ